MDTRSHLKQIALTRFARHGYEGVSLAQIAAEAGIKKPSIYNHFESKAALFLELADDAENTILALVTESLASQRQAPFEQRLRHLVECCCTISYREHQGVFYKRFLLFPPQELSHEARALSARAERRLDQRLGEIFSAGQADAALHPALDEAAFIAAFYCLVDGLLSETFMYDKAALARRFEGVWQVFWRGVRAG